jgi:hypothetical protein
MKALLLLLGTAALQAHEIGTTRVSVLFKDSRTYEVEVVTDARALAEKLQAVNGITAPVPAGASRLRSLIADSDEQFRRRVKLAFDGAEVRPAIAYSVEPPIDALSASAATIWLTGEVPANARDFTWNYGWTFSTYSINVRTRESEPPSTLWLEGGDTSPPVMVASPDLQFSRMQIALRYLTLGFTHILPYGFDHVLFVLGIYLLSRRAKPVLWQVSAFTIAHSITLGLSLYGLISASARIVEPMIAVSIAYVAVENLFLSELRPWRVALVFAFGLLHGMGFAGALRELGLPRAEFASALAAFNLGVEAGQLAVIGAAFLLVGRHCSQKAWYRSRIAVPASAAIAGIALFWTIERITA